MYTIVNVSIDLKWSYFFRTQNQNLFLLPNYNIVPIYFPLPISSTSLSFLTSNNILKSNCLRVHKWDLWSSSMSSLCAWFILQWVQSYDSFKFKNTEKYSLCICTMFIHSLIDGHLGWFLILASVDTVPINWMGLQMSFEQTDFISFGFILTREIVNQRTALFLIFLMMLKTIFADNFGNICKMLIFLQK